MPPVGDCGGPDTGHTIIRKIRTSTHRRCGPLPLIIRGRQRDEEVAEQEDPEGNGRPCARARSPRISQELRSGSSVACRDTGMNATCTGIREPDNDGKRCRGTGTASRKGVLGMARSRSGAGLDGTDEHVFTNAGASLGPREPVGNSSKGFEVGDIPPPGDWCRARRNDVTRMPSVGTSQMSPMRARNT